MLRRVFALGLEHDDVLSYFGLSELGRREDGLLLTFLSHVAVVVQLFDEDYAKAQADAASYPRHKEADNFSNLLHC
jgi:hypothetical protein